MILTAIRHGAWLLIMGIMFIGDCASSQETSIAVGTAHFQVEVARTLEERQRGLMFRTYLPENHGMLFIQPEVAPATFWMKNTYIPLDILYFDADGRLLETHADVPPCTTPKCPIYSSTEPVKYILELNAGTASRLGFKPGDPLYLD
jgi:uncharacterized membrane protein (UPF0127 family)